MTAPRDTLLIRTAHCPLCPEPSAPVAGQLTQRPEPAASAPNFTDQTATDVHLAGSDGLPTGISICGDCKPTEAFLQVTVTPTSWPPDRGSAANGGWSFAKVPRPSELTLDSVRRPHPTTGRGPDRSTRPLARASRLTSLAPSQSVTGVSKPSGHGPD